MSAVLAVSFVGAEWMTRVVFAVRHGMYDFDTLYYHLPIAARFAQLQSTTHLHNIGPGQITGFFPVNSELLHAIGMILIGNDSLSPYLNLLWLGLLLLAAWCVGRHNGSGALCVVAACVAMALPVISFTQAGSAESDLAALAMLVASVALLVESDGDRAVVGIAGAAAGIALGSKLTAVVGVGILAAAVVLAFRRFRALNSSPVATAVCWLLPLAATGGYWYGRNLAVAHSPIPPLAIPLLPRPFEAIQGQGRSLAHYIADGHLWRTAFLPGLGSSLGHAWPAILFAFAGGVWTATRNQSWVIRIAGIVALASAIGYVFTPSSAQGSPGRPLLFALNLRYLVPSLALGLILLAASDLLAHPRRRLASGLVGLSLVVVGGSSIGYTRAWLPTDHAESIGIAVLATAWFTVALVLWPRLPRTVVRLSVVSAAACVAIGLSLVLTRHYLANRYAQPTALGTAVQAPIYQWAHHVHHEQIGIDGFLQQYPLYGPNLSNKVQYIGHSGPRGKFGEYAACSSWQRSVLTARYRYVVIAPTFDSTPDPPQVAYALALPGAKVALHRQSAWVFDLSDLRNQAGCT